MASATNSTTTVVCRCFCSNVPVVLLCCSTRYCDAINSGILPSLYFGGRFPVRAMLFQCSPTSVIRVPSSRPLHLELSFPRVPVSGLAHRPSSKQDSPSQHCLKPSIDIVHRRSGGRSFRATHVCMDAWHDHIKNDWEKTLPLRDRRSEKAMNCCGRRPSLHPPKKTSPNRVSNKTKKKSPSITQNGQDLRVPRARLPCVVAAPLIPALDVFVEVVGAAALILRLAAGGAQVGALGGSFLCGGAEGQGRGVVVNAKPVLIDLAVPQTVPGRNIASDFRQPRLCFIRAMPAHNIIVNVNLAP